VCSECITQDRYTPKNDLNAEPLPRREITVHFTGSCLGNPGPGGYAAILVNTLTGARKALKGPCGGNTTNSRAVLTAAIKTLEFIRHGAVVIMTSDSQYVVEGMREWLPRWKARGWRGKDGKHVQNLDLWLDLDESSRKPAELEWVWQRGQDGNGLHEEASRLAKTEAAKLRRA
jgi:ribonuclease HI